MQDLKDLPHAARTSLTLVLLAGFVCAGGPSQALASESALAPNAISASVARLTSRPLEGSVFEELRTPAIQASVTAPKKKRSVVRTVLGVVAGGAIGLFVGAFAGASIQGDCDCDDPGLVGAVVGGGVGMVAGAVTGGILLGK